MNNQFKQLSNVKMPVVVYATIGGFSRGLAKVVFKLSNS